MSGYVTTGNYEVVEYLEGTGTQYFDTGFIPNQDTRVRFKIKIQTLENEHWGFFGAGQSYDSRAFECYTWKRSQGNTSLEFNYNNNYQFGDDVHVGDIVEIDFNKNIVKYKINDGVEKTITFTYENFSAPHSMYIFSTHRPGSSPLPQSCTFADVYNIDIYDNGTLVRSYKPAQSLDGTSLGLYDTVNDTFITNSGTGEFISGEPTGEFVDTKTSTRLKVNASKDITQLDYDLAECEDGWFNRYTRVNYVESQGNAYINLNYYPNQDTCVEIDCQYTSQSETLQWIYGSRDNYFVNIFALSPNNSIDRWIFGYNTDIGNGITPVSPDTNRHVFKQDANKCYIDRTLIYTYPYNEFQCTSNMTVFTLHSPAHGGYYTRAFAKLYEMKVSELGVMKVHLIPCIKKEGNIAGLYDMVSKQFLSSATGNSFIPGPIESHFDYQKFHMYCARPIYQLDIDIADKVNGWFGDYIRCDYIESNSGAYINTGVLPTPKNFKIEVKGIQIQSRSLFGTNGPGVDEIHFTGNGPSFARYCEDVRIGEFIYMSGVHIFTLDTGKMYVDGELKTPIKDPSTIPDDPTTLPMFLFSRNKNGSSEDGGNHTIYSAKIWNNGELVRDYVPCIRRSDMKAGLYDLVDQQFYASPNNRDFIPSSNIYEFDFVKY